jgi:S-adenosylmethionine/arginine decarboxylase-like enzyme
MLQHKHLLIRAEVKNPPQNEEYIKEWFRNLISRINMKLLMGPISAYVDVPGNKGLTCVAIIETSHIAMHVWDENDPGLMQLDVYTCGALNIEDVFAAIEEFKPISIDYKYLDREHEFKVLNQNKAI